LIYFDSALCLIKLTKKYHSAMCTSNEDCVEFVAKEDKHKVQMRFTPYGGVMQYTLLEGLFSGSFDRPQLSYLSGLKLAVSSRRWMSAVSGIVDLSLDIRFQFKNIRDIAGKHNFAYGWSGVIGYTFQIC